MKKKYLKALGVTVIAVMVLFVLISPLINHEDPPLKGQNITIQHYLC